MLLFPTSYSAQSNKVDCVRPSRLALGKHRKSEKILDYRGNKKKSLNATKHQACCIMVPETGLEPVWSRPRGILSPLRLPFRHSGSRKNLSQSPT